MAKKQKSKSCPIAAFTPDGEFLAILSPNGIVKVWNTGNGSLLAEWKQSDDSNDASMSYSCMACSFVGKKRKKDRATFLIALGTSGGDVLMIDAFKSDIKWNISGHHAGGVVGLAFANKGLSLRSIGTNGKVSEMNSESGELTMESKVSKKPISSLGFCSDEDVLAVVSNKTQVLSLENGKELLKFSDELAPVQYISISNMANNIVTSGFGDKNLQLWECDLSSKSVSAGPILSMRHPPLTIECKNRGNQSVENGLAVLAVAESGVTYVWNLKTISQDDVNPTKITVKSSKTEANQQKEYSKKHTSILAAKLNDFKDDKQLTAVIAYGLIDSPKFTTVNISNSGENVVVNDTDENETAGEIGGLPGKDHNALESESMPTSTGKQKTKKKRAASEMDSSAAGEIDTENGEAMDGVLVEDDVNEPTMGEKLASLYLHDDDKTKELEKPESTHAKPPSADSVDILLKQALHAEDRALLLDCLYTQDKKVIANSISQLSPSDVFKLLHSLLAIIDSRGAILACALPWLESLLLQHASGILSQDSSLVSLNSLYQLIESRTSTFQSALQLSSCLDFLYTEVVDDISEENEKIVPVIYEDKDESEDDETDEQESEDDMQTDQDSEGEEDGFGGFSDLDDGRNE